ncbi:LysM peptidoglycan-binding domain-containing protein [Paenibacillus solani]|uniref:LysM peptidoglycan-binding domain-containing protein n=1 Tax=Paenibacillus solani TaxID=1705565 RepID=UPI003D2A5FCA
MKIHIVKEGDTLYELSKKYNVPLTKLIDANPQLVDPNQLDVGAKIKVPTEPVLVPGGGQPIIHKHSVKQGDSLWKLSKAWGVTLKEIIDANPQLKNPNALLVGEVVNIPSSDAHMESDTDGYSMNDSSGMVPGKKKPGSKDYTGVKKEETAPIEQPPVVIPEVKEPEPPILPKLPEISPFPEEPKKFEPEFKPEILPEIKKPIIMPEIKKPEIMPEIKKPEIMPEIKKPEIMPEIKLPNVMPEFKKPVILPEFKPEFIPPYKPVEPEYTFPVKTMPLPHPVHPIAAEPCPPFMELPIHMMPNPCPDFPDKMGPAFAMPPYGYPKGPCGCHESHHGNAAHPYHHIHQEAMPATYNEGWGNPGSAYPGISEQPISLEYTQLSVTQSYTGNMGSDYHPYPAQHHEAMTYGYVPSPCGCHGGEASPFYNMPTQGYPQYGHHSYDPGMAAPYQPWQGGMDYNANMHSSPSGFMGTHGGYPQFVNPYEPDWNDRQQNDQQFDSSFNSLASFDTQQTNLNISSDVEGDSVSNGDADIEEAPKAKAKVHRQEVNKITTAAKKSRKQQSSASKRKHHNPWIKG